MRSGHLDYESVSSAKKSFVITTTSTPVICVNVCKTSEMVKTNFRSYIIKHSHTHKILCTTWSKMADLRKRCVWFSLLLSWHVILTEDIWSFCWEEYSRS